MSAFLCFPAIDKRIVLSEIKALKLHSPFNDIYDAGRNKFTSISGSEFFGGFGS